MREIQSLFRINLSNRYRLYLRPLRSCFMAVCLLLAIAVIWDVGQIWIGYSSAMGIDSALQRVKEQDTRLLKDAGQEGIDLTDPAMQRLPNEVAFANQLIEKRVFSWTHLLTDLEHAIPSRVAINSIRLDVGNWTIRLTGSALNLEDVTALTVAMQDHLSFKDPVLGQHRANENGLVDFDLAVRYQSAKQ